MITVKYLRTDHTQSEIAETLNLSQPTISWAVCALTDALARALEHVIPTAEDVDLTSTVLIDGTLLPCWSWKTHPDLWSGKHRHRHVPSESPATWPETSYGCPTHCQGPRTT